MRRSTTSRRRGTAQLPPAWPRAAGWVVVAAVALTLLLALGWLVGSDEPRLHGRVAEPLEHTLRMPVVASLCAALLVLLLLWAIRHAYLWELTVRPGPINVPNFTATDPALEPRVQAATILFRRMLGELHLDADASSQPGVSDATEFVDLVGTVSMDPKKALASAVALIRAAAPTHAYEVKGVLQQREQDPCCGVAVQVILRPKTASALQFCWAPTWDAALESAANSAAAFILPRTRRCRLAPWRAWRTYVMPAGLLDAYERGSALVELRRYEEALGLFRRALEEDPMNVDIRLRVGMVQEQLGLYLDAFDTYVSMDEIDHPAGRKLPLRAYPLRVTLARRRTQRVALYRRAILLGGEEVSEQWLRWVEGRRITARDRQRVTLRRRLRPWLSERWPTGEDEADGALAEPVHLRASDRPARRRELQHGLATLALADLDHLARRSPLRRGSPLSPAAIATSHACVSLRRDLLTEAAPASAGGRAAQESRHTDTATLRRTLDAALRRRGRHSWDAHYNGACLYAIALERARTEELSATLARAAVKELTRAISYADSGYVANRAPWLLREDPDLAALRRRPEFWAFEAQYFARDHRADERVPPNRHVAALREHTLRLCAGYAERLEGLWHRRALEAAKTDIHDIGRWWGRELEAWQLIADLAVHYRDWETRLLVIDRLRAWAQESGIDPLEIPYPPSVDWSRDPLDSEQRIGMPADVARAGSPLSVHLDLVDGRLREIDRQGRGVSPEQLIHVSRCQAALWQTVREDVEPPRDRATRAARRSLRADLGDVLAYFTSVPGARAALMRPPEPEPEPAGDGRVTTAGPRPA